MTVPKSGRTNVIRYLRELPEFFFTSDAMRRFHWTSEQASVYMARWKARGLVAPLGGRSDIYFNELMSPGASEKHFQDALARAMPAAVRLDPGLLQEAGVSTQFYNRVIVAALHGTPAYTIPGLDVVRRSKTWFETMHPFINFGTVLPRLSPEAVLVETMRAKDLPRIDHDDIDWDEVKDSIFRKAYLAFNERTMGELPAEQLYRESDISPAM